MQHGNTQYNQPSRFLKEIPPHNIEWIENNKNTDTYGLGGSFSALKEQNLLSADKAICFHLFQPAILTALKVHHKIKCRSLKTLN